MDWSHQDMKWPTLWRGKLQEIASKQFTGFDMSTKLKLIGVDVGSFGDPFGETAGSIPIAFQDKRNGVYKRINISEDGKYLLGGILIGDASQYNILHQMVVNKMLLPAQAGITYSLEQVEKRKQKEPA